MTYPPEGDPYGYGPPPYQPAPGPAPYSPMVPMVPVVPIAVQNPGQGMGTASMVLGILGLVFGCCSFGIFSLLAVIFGHVGLGQSKRVGQGNGMAVAGLVMGYILIIPAVLFSVYVIFMGGLTAMTGATVDPTTTP